MYDSAIGVHGMFKLQNYGNATLIYDGHTYTTTSNRQ